MREAKVFFPGLLKYLFKCPFPGAFSFFDARAKRFQCAASETKYLLLYLIENRIPAMFG